MFGRSPGYYCAGSSERRFYAREHSSIALRNRGDWHEVVIRAILTLRTWRVLRLRMWQPTTLAPEGRIPAYAVLACGCPSRRIFLAALWSRCRLVPHSGHACQRTDKPLETIAPQPGPEHRWLVNAGLTACTHFPAFAALEARMVKNALHLASAILLARE